MFCLRLRDAKILNFVIFFELLWKIWFWCYFEKRRRKLRFAYLFGIDAENSVWYQKWRRKKVSLIDCFLKLVKKYSCFYLCHILLLLRRNGLKTWPVSNLKSLIQDHLRFFH